MAMVRRIFGSLGSPMADAAVMMVDLNEACPPDQMWEVLTCSGIGFLSTNPMSVALPESGLFVIPRHTPVETLAEGVGATPSPAGVSLVKRGSPIAMFCGSKLLGGGVGYSAHMEMQASQPQIVLPGETIRMVMASNPGTVAPGPGAGSYCSFSAVVRVIRALTP